MRSSKSFPRAAWLLAVACAAFAGCASRQDAAEGKSYVPAYAAGAGTTRPEAKGTIAYDFAQAASAKTLGEAAANWEAFLKKHEPADGELEDSSQKRYLDAAGYELMRVYYLLGRTTDGDRMLQKLDPLGVNP